MSIFNDDTSKYANITPPLTQALVDDLKHALQDGPQEDMDEALRKQVLLLDKAFRRLLCDADVRKKDRIGKTWEFVHLLNRYELALQAQHQSQATAKTLGALKYMEALSAPKAVQASAMHPAPLPQIGQTDCSEPK